MALINIGVAGVWHLMMPGIVRWTVTVGAVLLAYLGLSRSFVVQRPRRIYRYAD
jgi:hypothetical protein